MSLKHRDDDAVGLARLLDGMERRLKLLVILACSLEGEAEFWMVWPVDAGGRIGAGA